MPETAPARDRATRAGLLAAVSDAYAAVGGDATLAAQTVCNLVAEAVDDAVVMRLVDEDGRLPLVAVGATDPAVAADIIRTFGPIDAPREVAGTLQAGLTRFGPADGRGGAVRAFEERVGYRGSIVAPLWVRGRPFGTVSLICTRHPEGHPVEDDELLAEIADRCARDVDQLRLLHDLHRELGERSIADRRRAAMLHHTSDLIVMVSAMGQVLDVTPSSLAVLGRSPEEIRDGSLFDHIDLADRARVAAEFQGASIAVGDVGRTEFRVRHRDGSVRWLDVTANNLLDDPDVGALVISARDVTDRHRSSELLAAENDLLQRIVGGDPVHDVFDALCRLLETHITGCVASVWMLEDEDRLVLQAMPTIDFGDLDHEFVLSASYIGLTNRDHPEILVTEVGGKEWEGHEEVAAAFGIRGSWSRAVVEPNGEVHGSIVLFHGECRRPTAHQVRVIELATHLAGMAVSRDRSSRALTHAANHDALTGLPNRSLFLDRLGRILTRSGPEGEVAVIFVDLDDFKLVNDTSGHAVGDELLREAAIRLAGVVRPLDLIARLGGDEFAVLCDGLDLDGAAPVAQRILDVLEAPFELDGRRFHVSASAGIALGSGATSPDALLRDADTAMYQSKRGGRARYTIYSPEVRQAAVRRLALERDLRRAIEQDEITVHYQPVVSLKTGRLSGLEALARWTSPEHGVVPPIEFIDVAEGTGMIGILGAAILGKAVERAAAWRRAGLIDEGVTVAVNVSARQLADPSFVELVLSTLDDAGLPPENLCLELTESAVMADVEVAEATLGLLRGLGITLAIDDFGTGHSSLARLRTLEATVLKLDRMFILDLEVDEGCVELVSSVVKLAHSLGKRLVVEGVELPTQLRILRQLGADAAQGYHLGRPQAPESIEGFLRVNQTWKFAGRG